MGNHLHSADDQARAPNELQSIDFQKFVDKEDTMAKALSTMSSYIANRSTQCAPTFHSELHRVEYLKRALMTYSWEQPVLAKITQATDYQVLSSELANALQFYEEVQASGRRRGEECNQLRTRATSSTAPTSEKPLIYFTQPRYAKEIAWVLFPGSERDRSCWNCGEKGHQASKCKKSPDAPTLPPAKPPSLNGSAAKRTGSQE